MYDKDPSPKFLESCERGILVPILIDQDFHLIDGVKRAVGAFTAQLPHAPCLVLPPLGDAERLALRVLLNPDRTPTDKTRDLLAGKANFGHMPNLRYRTDILKKATEAVARRHAGNSKLAKSSLRLNSSFLKRQCKVAELTAEAIHELDTLLAWYPEKPKQLSDVRHWLASATKMLVRFRQPNPKPPPRLKKKRSSCDVQLDSEV